MATQSVVNSYNHLRRVDLLLQLYTQFLTQWLQHFQVLLVLVVILCLELETFEDAHSKREVIHAASGLEGALNHLW